MSTSRYTDFSKGQDLEKCIFRMLKTNLGNYNLCTIFADISEENKANAWFYTFEQLNDIPNYVVVNKKTTNSKYTTLKGFINRLKQDRNEKLLPQIKKLVNALLLRYY